LSTGLKAMYRRKGKQHHGFITDGDAGIVGKICVRKDQEIRKELMIGVSVKAINRELHEKGVKYGTNQDITRA
jgi:hypothetical protein